MSPLRYNLLEESLVYYVNSRRNVDSEKSEPQMGFEPTTLRDQVIRDLD